MDIRSHVIEQTTVAELTGDIDAKTVIQAQERLLHIVQPGMRLVLDMHGVTYMSSSGLRMLLSLYRQISSNGGAIALARLPAELEDTMSVTGFLRYFAIYDTVADALRGMG